MRMAPCPVCQAEGRLLEYPGARKVKCAACGVVDAPLTPPPITVPSVPVVYANGHDVAPRVEAPPPVLREPGADEAEDEFQHAEKEWQTRVYDVAHELLISDKVLREKEGKDLQDDLVISLDKLVTQVATYQPPEALPPEEVRPSLVKVATKAIKARIIEFPSVKKEPEPTTMVEVLELGEVYTLIDEWDRQPWVWDGILPHSSLSLISGKSETGKSTLIYSLIYGIITGTEFLGRKCEQGRVLYLAGDPASEIVLGKQFRELGITEGITVMRGALVAEENKAAMALLRKTIERVKPILVVADTLAATVPLDTDKYGQSYQSQQPLSQLARQYKPNFMMSHHSQKSAMATYGVIDAALGSVGVAAVASTRMSTKLHRKKGEKYYTFEMSNLRMGRPLEGEMIVKRLNTGLVVQDGMWREASMTMTKDAIIQILTSNPQGLVKRTLLYEMNPRPEYGQFVDALEELWIERRISKSPRPGRGGGIVYTLRTPSQNGD